jgi:hypothetical protein
MEACVLGLRRCNPMLLSSMSEVKVIGTNHIPLCGSRRYKTSGSVTRITSSQSTASILSMLIFVVRVTPSGPRTDFYQDVSTRLQRRNPVHLFRSLTPTLPILTLPPLLMAGVNSPAGKDPCSSYTLGNDKRTLLDSTEKRIQREC